ncbi:MAG: ABC transporter ATP-binding protein [Chlamydiae bacterium]|nr:ABC transporter ATP-binding protein [Chlamydiota bacterium]
MTKPLLEIQNLSLSFKMEKQYLSAIRDISFSLYPGEILGIVGESGCGKTALARAILKLFPPHSTSVNGKIFYKDENLLEFSEKQMRAIRGKEIGMIFQDPMTSLNPTMKIGDQVVEGCLNHNHSISAREAKKLAVELLDVVGISQPDIRIQDYPHMYSGGMRQRAMIALALACRPKILIADEPTTSLDVTIQAQILDLMERIQKKTNTSIILITHDLSLVAGFCHRVVVMYAGKIVEIADVEDLFTSPRHPYTARLLQSIPRLDTPKDHPLIPIEGTHEDLLHSTTGCSFCHRCTSAMNICVLKDPSLVEIAKRHHTACWLNDAPLN